MKVVFFETENWETDYLRNQLNGFDASFVPGKLTAENIETAKEAEIISVFVDSQLTKDILENLSNLKMIAARSTGFDHIDVNFCEEKGIIVCNVPYYGENTVAEHAFALMLDLSRKIHESVGQVKEEGFAAKGLRGFDLKGKTLGIIGLGRIGQHVARIAQGFEMDILVYDAFPDKKLAKKLNLRYFSLEDLLKSSDILTLHIPLNEKTKHLINGQNINLIKKGAYLINTARGGIVETAALVLALEKGILAGAGLDVLEEECYIKEEGQFLSEDFYKKCDVKTMLANHILMDKKNVIITPHNAWNSNEAIQRILDTTIENIKGFAKGKPINIVK